MSKAASSTDPSGPRESDTITSSISLKSKMATLEPATPSCRPASRKSRYSLAFYFLFDPLANWQLSLEDGVEAGRTISKGSNCVEVRLNSSSITWVIQSTSETVFSNGSLDRDRAFKSEI